MQMHERMAFLAQRLVSWRLQLLDFYTKPIHYGSINQLVWMKHAVKSLQFFSLWRSIPSWRTAYLVLLSVHLVAAIISTCFVCASVSDQLYNTSQKETSTKHVPTGSSHATQLVRDIAPSREDFFQQLNAAGKPAILSLVPEYVSRYMPPVDTGVLPKLLTYELSINLWRTTWQVYVRML